MLLHSRSWWIFSSGNAWQYQGAVHLAAYKRLNRNAFSSRGANRFHIPGGLVNGRRTAGAKPGSRFSTNDRLLRGRAIRGGLGKGVKVQAGERTISSRVETKRHQGGSCLIPGAALAIQAQIFRKGAGASSRRCVLTEEPGRAHGLVALGRGQPAAGIPPPRASLPGSARQCPPRAGRGAGRGRANRGRAARPPLTQCGAGALSAQAGRGAFQPGRPQAASPPEGAGRTYRPSGSRGRPAGSAAAALAFQARLVPAPDPGG